MGSKFGKKFPTAKLGKDQYGICEKCEKPHAKILNKFTINLNLHLKSEIKCSIIIRTFDIF